MAFGKEKEANKCLRSELHCSHLSQPIQNEQQKDSSNLFWNVLYEPSLFIVLNLDLVHNILSLILIYGFWEKGKQEKN